MDLPAEAIIGFALTISGGAFGLLYRQMEKMRVENRVDHKETDGKLTKLIVGQAKADTINETQGSKLDRLAARLDEHLEDHKYI